MSGEATLICWVLICPGGCGLLRVDRFLLCTEQSKDCPRMRKSELWPFRARPCYFRPLCLESGVSLALNLCCALRQMDEKHNPGKRSRLFCIYTNVTPFICLFFFFFIFFLFFFPQWMHFYCCCFPLIFAISVKANLGLCFQNPGRLGFKGVRTITLNVCTWAKLNFSTFGIEYSLIFISVTLQFFHLRCKT